MLLEMPVFRTRIRLHAGGREEGCGLKTPLTVDGDVDPKIVEEPRDIRGIPFDQVNEAIRGEEMDTHADSRWSRELSVQDSNWLNRFFHDERVRQ
jgi:hypothetical protein